MEVFRTMAAHGLASMAQQVTEQAPPLDLWRKFLYCETMTGPVYGEVDHFKVGQQAEMLCTVRRYRIKLLLL